MRDASEKYMRIQERQRVESTDVRRADSMGYTRPGTEDGRHGEYIETRDERKQMTRSAKDERTMRARSTGE